MMVFFCSLTDMNILITNIYEKKLLLISAITSQLLLSPVHHFKQIIFAAKFLWYYMTINFHLSQNMFWHTFKVEYTLFVYLFMGSFKIVIMSKVSILASTWNGDPLLVCSWKSWTNWNMWAWDDASYSLV